MNHKHMSFEDVARSHKLMNWILTNKKAELISRYKELRNDILSEGNLLLKFSNFICQIPQCGPFYYIYTPLRMEGYY